MPRFLVRASQIMEAPDEATALLIMRGLALPDRYLAPVEVRCPECGWLGPECEVNELEWEGPETEKVVGHCPTCDAWAYADTGEKS